MSALVIISALNTELIITDRASLKIKNKLIASSSLEKRIVLVYINSDNLPTLSRLSDLISIELEAISSSIAS
jgi:hypothetical protein